MTPLSLIASAEVLTTAHTHATLDRGGWALIAIGVAIWIFWPIVAIEHWQNVIESHARLGYFIGDMTIVAPLCFASGYGSVAATKWASPMLLLTVGAAAYDLTHFLIFLAQIHVPKIKGKPLPVVAYVAAILAVLAFLAWIAWRVIQVEITPPGGALAELNPSGPGLHVAIAAVVAGGLVSGGISWMFLRGGRPSTTTPPGSSPPEA